MNTANNVKNVDRVTIVIFVNIFNIINIFRIVKLSKVPTKLKSSSVYIPIIYVPVWTSGLFDSIG